MNNTDLGTPGVVRWGRRRVAVVPHLTELI